MLGPAEHPHWHVSVSFLTQKAQGPVSPIARCSGFCSSQPAHVGNILPGFLEGTTPQRPETASDIFGNPSENYHLNVELFLGSHVGAEASNVGIENTG